MDKSRKAKLIQSENELNPLLDHLDPSIKGFPDCNESLLLNNIGKQKWNILKGDVPFPSAVLLESALRNNASWMRDFLEHTHLSFAPHGKTTLSPQLFKQQLAAGAWGITVATYQQVYIAWRAGVRCILFANQLIDRASIHGVLTILKKDPELKFYCLVDSSLGCDMLADAAKKYQLAKPISVLLELGCKGGRTGCRSNEDALILAKRIYNSPYLQFSGIECYEGILVTENKQDDITEVNALLNRVSDFAKKCDEDNLFKNVDEVLLTAGGSSYFDLVAACFTQVLLKKPTRVVVRSGCYLTHDAKFQESLFRYMQQRLAKVFPTAQQFEPALEIWSVVQSCPEPGLAILSLGKRDASYDIDLPIPLKWFNPIKQVKPEPLTPDWTILKLNDQHAYLYYPSYQDVRVGDLIGCGISHPCTTFDKWKLLYVVDENYFIVDAIKTYF